MKEGVTTPRSSKQKGIGIRTVFFILLIATSASGVSPNPGKQFGLGYQVYIEPWKFRKQHQLRIDSHFGAVRLDRSPKVKAASILAEDDKAVIKVPSHWKLRCSESTAKLAADPGGKKRSEEKRSALDKTLRSCEKRDKKVHRDESHFEPWENRRQFHRDESHFAACLREKKEVKQAHRDESHFETCLREERKEKVHRDESHFEPNQQEKEEKLAHRDESHFESAVEEKEEKIGEEKFVDKMYEKFRSLAWTTKAILCRAKEAMAEELQAIGAALNQLVRGQSSSQWSKHLKAPDVFKPKTREEELTSWADWKFGFENYVRSLDPSIADRMKQIEGHIHGDYEYNKLEGDDKEGTTCLYSVMVSYMRERPLKLVRNVEDQNGHKAWQLLLKEMQPSTRARGLALLTQLSRVTFSESKSVTEQLAAYETLVREYERVSGGEYPEDSKVAAVLMATPPAMRTQLQMIIGEHTTYEELKDRIHHYESVTAKWTSDNVLTMPGKASDESSPMDVDYIQNKGKGKGKKGKEKGKGKGKDYKGKGKSTWSSSSTGKGKGYGYSYEKGKSSKGKSDKGKGDGKGKSKEGCFTCGKPGHKARDCWRRVQQVESTAGGSAASTVTTQPASTVNQSELKNPTST